MKNLFAILFLLVCSVFTFAQKQPKTVTEFYLALPNSKVDVKGLEDSEFPDPFFFLQSHGSYSDRASVGYRRSLIRIEDIKNGYLRLQGRGWEGWSEVALFKKADGEYLVAISEVECGPGCGGPVMFLTYNDGKWTDVTTQVFPSDTRSDRGYFRLPRVGTTIELHGGEDCGAEENCQNRQKLAEFKWNKERFVK
jgi:hypothetical protein